MIIQNREHKYVVIQKIQDGEMIEEFICRDVQSSFEQEYRIARVLTKVLPSGLIPYLLNISQNGEFKDFREYFTDEQYLYLVVSENIHMTLKDRLDQDICGLAERIQIGMALLEHLVLLDPPPYFAASAMSLQGIGISKAMEIEFRYDLSRLFRYQDYGMKQVEDGLFTCFHRLYQKELELKAFPEMEALLTELSKDSYEDYVSIYARFRGIYEVWQGRGEESLKPQSRSFRLWEILKRIGKILKSMVSVLILLLALVYLILSVRAFTAPHPSIQNYKNIGTVEIQKQGG